MEILNTPVDIDLEMSLTSGQAFHWKKFKDGYGIVSGNSAWYIQVEEDHWKVFGSSSESLLDYLDGKKNYCPMRCRLKEDLTLAIFVEEGRGLRLLQQEPWETIVAFILSANNNMGRIQRSILSLSEMYGEELGTINGEKFYALPSPETLSQLDPKELRENCGVGYRDNYLIGTAKLISDGTIDLNAIGEMDLKEAKATLMKLPGVGTKVADCILLFGYHFEECFPVDIWMERVMETLYGPFTSRREIANFGAEKFGHYAGYVQQLLFHYSRTKDSLKPGERNMQ